MSLISTITDKENVVRVLHQDWVDNGVIQLGAFTLRPNETYISVNRPSIPSFASDVSNFVETHSMYQHTKSTYMCAALNVEGIRGIKLTNNGELINIDVEVEPRAVYTGSHAGIFTRLGTTNIKKGTMFPAETLPIGLSADDILMEVGWSLIALSTLQEKHFKDE